MYPAPSHLRVLRAVQYVFIFLSSQVFLSLSSALFACVFACVPPLLTFAAHDYQAGSLTSWLAFTHFNPLQSSHDSCVAPLSDMQLLISGIWSPVR